VNKPSNIALDATARQGVPSGSKRCRGPRVTASVRRISGQWTALAAHVVYGEDVASGHCEGGTNVG